MRLDENKIRQAKYFAIGAHGQQKRKYTGEPYWTHLENVAKIVRGVLGVTIEMVCAAWLHDVVEDTTFSILEIQELFGTKVASFVSDLTEPPKEFGNREKRKSAYNLQLCSANPGVQTIKYADLIDNTATINLYDPKFAETYLAEKRILLPMIQNGDPNLYKIACEQCGMV